MRSMPTRTRTVMTAFAGLTAIAVAGCTSAAPEDAGQADGEASTQVVLANAEPPTAAYWDPAASFGLVDDQVASLVYDTLLTMDSSGTLGPGLATDWSRVSDTELTVTLREDATFHDGTPVTADDVVASLARLMDGTGALAKSALLTPGTVTADGNVITVTTDAPYGPLENSLANVAILAKADIDDPDNFSETANGSGPYTFESYTGDDITLVANEEYWDGAPEIDTVVLRYIADADARFNALLAGQVDIATRVAPNYVDRIESNDDFYIEAVSPPSMIVMIEQHNGPLADARVRQAIAYAIDREAIAETIMRGVNAVPLNALPTTLESYEPADETFEHNPDRARTLLAEAGFEDGLTLTLATSTLVPNQLVIDQAIVQYLGDVGVNVDVTQLEVGEFRTSYNTYDLSMNTLTSFNNDAGFILTSFTGPVGEAIFHYSDPTAEELIAASNAATGDERDAAIDAAATYLWDDQVTLVLSDETWSTLVSDRVTDYERAPLVGEPLLAQASIAN